MQKSLAKNMLYKVLLNVFNLVVPLLVGPYVLYTLGPTSVGTVQFGESIFNYFFIFAVFGVYQYGLREVSKVKNDKEKVSELFTSLFVISIMTSLGSLLLYVLFSYIGYGDRAVFPVLLIFGLYFISTIFLVEWVNEAFENYDFITIKTIIVRLLYIVFLFIIVKSADDYKEYATLLVLSTFLNNLISFVYIKRKVKFNFKKVSILKHIKPLWLVVVFSNASVLYIQLDRFMLGEFVNEESVAFYGTAQQMMTIINAVILSIIQVTIPRLSHLSGNEDHESYIKLLNTISKMYFFILFPAAVGLFVISDVGVLLYGGEKFAPAGSVLAIFAIYMIAMGIESILANQIIYVKQQERVLVKFAFTCGFINLVLNAILIQMKLFTPAAAVATTAFSTFVLLLLEYRFVRKTLKVPYNLFEPAKLKYLLYALSFIPLSYIVRMYVSGTIPLLIVLVIVSGFAYVLLLVVTKDEMLFLFMSKVKAKLGRA